MRRKEMCHLISFLKDTIPIRNSGKRMNKNVFPRRGVSLEGDPIARSRQVEAKQPTAMKTNNKKKNKKQKQKTARQCHLLSF